jgi:Single-strand binding protein family
MSRALPPLLCGHCGACEVPIIGPGAGQHVARANCRHCGRYLKWLPKVLFEKEPPRMGGLAKCIIVGYVGKYGAEMRYATSGSPCASFTLVVSELGQDGKVHDLYVPCEVWGKKAEGVSELEAGQLALFEGKLAKRKKGEQWEMVVAGFDVTPIVAPVASLTGRTN